MIPYANNHKETCPTEGVLFSLDNPPLKKRSKNRAKNRCPVKIIPHNETLVLSRI
jgi:hypothetical protein